MAAPSSATIRILLAGLALALAGCASNPPAPVEDRTLGEDRDRGEPAPRAEPVDSGDYTVAPGDTLYGIAFKKGLDYRDIARWNGLRSPDKIFVGQRLRLQGRTSEPPPTRDTAPIAVKEPSLADEIAAEEGHKPTTHRDAPITPLPPSKAPLAKAELEKSGRTDVLPVAVAKPESAPGAADATPPPLETFKPVVAAAPTPTAIPVSPDKSTAPPPAMPSSASVSSGGVTWRWPAAGKVVGTYVAGDQTRQGIDIGGKAGDAVVAAADGTVVYSGNGLIGYGELIIVKHNASFLSAYGHNRKRLVKEGEAVKAGQAIAEMGSSAASREGLHFEIRKNGKPTNPLEFLPAK